MGFKPGDGKQRSPQNLGIVIGVQTRAISLFQDGFSFQTNSTSHKRPFFSVPMFGEVLMLHVCVWTRWSPGTSLYSSCTARLTALGIYRANRGLGRVEKRRPISQDSWDQRRVGCEGRGIPFCFRYPGLGTGHIVITTTRQGRTRETLLPSQRKTPRKQNTLRPYPPYSSQISWGKQQSHP